eukprot:7861390-Ditylum_brightwellii.AAC.1
MDLEDDFMRRTRLREEFSSDEEKKEDDKATLGELREKMGSVERSVALLGDAMAAMKGKHDSENMVIDVGGYIFEGEKDVAAWMEKSMPTDCLFGVFVDVYVIMEMVLVEHTSTQAAEMERNYKLQLAAGKALVIKTFDNKLSTSLGQKVTADSTAVNMEITTKST